MPKIRKKSSIHENVDVNITCDFGDGDISRCRSRLAASHIVSSIIVRLLLVFTIKIYIPIYILVTGSYDILAIVCINLPCVYVCMLYVCMMHATICKFHELAVLALHRLYLIFNA